MVSIPYSVHSESCPFGICVLSRFSPFGIVSIQDCVHSERCTYGIVSIPYGVHSRSCPFGIVSFRDRVHSGSCPFRMMYILDGVHSGFVAFREGAHLGSCTESPLTDSKLLSITSLHERAKIFKHFYQILASLKLLSAFCGALCFL